MPALLLRDHPRHEGAHAVDGAAQIHAQAEIPIVIGRILRRPAEVDAGIAADDVDLARRVRRAREGLAVRHVEADGPHPLAARQRLHRLVECLLPDVRDHDPRAGLQEFPRHGEPDAGRAAGDEGRLVLEIVHAHSLLARRGDAAIDVQYLAIDERRRRR